MSSKKTYEMTLIVFLFTIYCSGVFSEGTGCQCVKTNYDCGCCVDVDIKPIGLDDTVCVNVTYLPKQYGINLLLTIDKHVVINDTISARNPPPICADVPYLKQYASVCIDFYNLDISKGKFSGCVDLEARLYHVFVEKVPLGCFNVGNNSVSKDYIMQMKQMLVAREKKLYMLSKREKDSFKKFIKL